MLRLFWPYSDSTRLTSDVDSIDPSSSTRNHGTGRFADTTSFWTTGTVNTDYRVLPLGFIRTVDATGMIRVAFDYYHANAGSDVNLLSITPTGGSTFSSSAAAATTLLTLKMSAATNRIAVTLANSTTTTGDSNLSSLEWHRIEIAYKPSNTVGELTVWVNDVEQTTISAAYDGNDDTILGSASVTSDLWFYFGTGTAAGARVSNLMIWDDSGTADDLTGFLGDCTPIKRVPTSDHDVDGTPSTPGNNYSMVADNAGTNYVTFENDGDFDLYGFAALGVTGTVKAVVVVAEGFLVGNGEARLKAVAKHTATVDESTVQSGTLTTYVAPRNVLQAAFVNVPNGTGWTVGQVDAAYFGVKGVIN